jgi:hypothetical protein
MCMLLGAAYEFLDCLDERQLTEIELTDAMGCASADFLRDYTDKFKKTT